MFYWWWSSLYQQSGLTNMGPIYISLRLKGTADSWAKCHTISTCCTGRETELMNWPFTCSSRSNVPVWPFLVLSCFGGAYALLPYFVLWRPPAPPVNESELRKWPLSFLESKITAGVCINYTIGFLTKTKKDMLPSGSFLLVFCILLTFWILSIVLLFYYLWSIVRSLLFFLINQKLK